MALLSEAGSPVTRRGQDPVADARRGVDVQTKTQYSAGMCKADVQQSSPGGSGLGTTRERQTPAPPMTAKRGKMEQERRF